MIPSEYETIIQMLLNEVIRLRRENDVKFRNALSEASFSTSYTNPVTGTSPIAFLTTSGSEDKKNNFQSKKKHEFYGNQYLLRNRKSRK